MERDVSLGARVWCFAQHPVNLVKIVLIAVGIVAGASYYAGLVRQGLQIWFFGLHAVLPGMVLLFAVTTVLTFAGGWARGWVSRLALAAILSAGTLVFVALRMTGGSAVTFNTLSILLDSRDAAPDVLHLYPTAIALAVLAGCSTLVGIALPPPATQRSRLAAPAVFVALALLCHVSARREGGGLGSAAPGWAAPIYAALVLYDRATTPVARFKPLLAAPTGRPPGDIVILVDESVGGQYLDINAPHGVRSGLNEFVARGDAANFGIAASATNFSVGSNFVLRTGGTRASHTQRTASIWAYARRAGYRTVYVYAQDYDGLQNLMSPAERAEIDAYVTVQQPPRDQRDAVAARMLHRLLHNGVAELIYVNKSGAHFPAWRSYPPSAVTYRPALGDLGESRTRAPTRARTGIVDIASPAVRQQYRNDYRNALGWNVGHFFDRLLRDGVPRGSTILYTSDHGEALGDRAPRQFGHGRVDNPAPEEGSVPMVVVSAPGEGTRWTAAAAANRGASHYRIFPTVLVLMGYDRDRVVVLFGPDLASSVPDPLTFNSRFYTRFGARPSWHRVDRNALMPVLP